MLNASPAKEACENVEAIKQLKYRSVHAGFGKSWTSDTSGVFIDAFDKVLPDMKKDGTVNETVLRNGMN